MSPTHRTRAAELADALSSSEGLILDSSDTRGLSREVSQETKLRRIDEYLTFDYDKLWDERVLTITEGPILVIHREELTVRVCLFAFNSVANINYTMALDLLLKSLKSR